MPSATPSIPNVATNGGISRATTSRPFAIPNIVPTPSAIAKAAGNDVPFTRSIASTTPDKPVTAPIDRSSPSVMMISVIGNASSRRMDDCVPTFKRFGADANRVPKTVKNTTSTARRYAMPGMRSGGRGLPMMHRQFKNVLFGQLVSLQLAGNGFVPHHIGAVAHGHDFRKFRTDHQHRRALRHNAIEQGKDFRFGSDVDAARRFIENEEA